MVSTDAKIFNTLRLACAMCFIGHGCFGLITKQIWFNYFAVFGIGHNLSAGLMPILGLVDIAMGVSLLIFPTRAIVLWLVVWGFITAMLRPLSGEPIWETFERAGNYGTPLALLLFAEPVSAGIKGWFGRMQAGRSVSNERVSAAVTCLKIVIFLLLAGHGLLNLTGKNGLLNQYSGLGFPNALITARYIGVFEILAALMVVVRPVRSFIFILLIWKIGSELFYPHWEVFEWIERGGSYGAILALWFALPRRTIIHGALNTTTA